KYPGKTAGPSFEFSRDLHLIPHKHAAWIIFHEQLNALSLFAFEFSKDNRASVNAQSTLAEVAEKIKGFAEKLKK
ncbi:MAG: hypothetical protein WCI97_12610, partial [Bacteroidota bacterium]